MAGQWDVVLMLKARQWDVVLSVRVATLAQKYVYSCMAFNAYYHSLSQTHAIFTVKTEML